MMDQRVLNEAENYSIQYIYIGYKTVIDSNIYMFVQIQTKLKQSKNMKSDKIVYMVTVIVVILHCIQ